MMTTKLRTLGLSAVLAVVFASAGFAADAPSSARMCGACHGKDGVSSKEMVPTIAGFSEFYLEDALIQYRDEIRACADAKTKTMCANAKKKLSDEEITEVASYFASLEFRPAEQECDADKAAAGLALHEDHCAKCHTEGGSNPDDDAGILAGQWIPYLKLAMMQYVNGEREQPEAMKTKISELSEADVEALAHYYGSQQ